MDCRRFGPLCVLTLSLVLPATSALAEVIITTNTTIAAGNTSIDNEDVVVRGAVLTINGTHPLNSLIVEDIGSVTHTATTVDGSVSGVFLDIATDAFIEAGSSVNLVSRGSAPGTGIGAGAIDSTGSSFRGGGGGGHGGVGGLGRVSNAGGATHGSITLPQSFGSGGGATGNGATGGAGGGAMRLSVAGTLTVDGTMNAGGGDGTLGSSSNGGGGGAGGSLLLEVAALAGSGSITANGGAGGAPSGTPIGGGGAGGRIAIFSDDITFAGSISACGGIGFMYGGAGTILTKSSAQVYGDLRIDNCANAGAITNFVGAASPSFDDLAVTAAAVLDVQSATTLTVENIDIDAGASLRHLAASAGLLTIDAAGNVFVASDGSIDLTARGSAAGTGTGAGAIEGTGSSNRGGGGGGHGGVGGLGTVATAGGVTHGSIASPQSFGSGGGATVLGATGGAGGGAVRLSVAGTLTIEGTLSAGGGEGIVGGSNNGGGGGAGGSLWLEVGTLTGAGTITANGGAGGAPSGIPRGGGGAGGRIAVHSDEVTFAGTLSACGGVGAQYGGAGTVLTRSSSQGFGELLFDNCSNVGAISDFAGAATPTFDSLEVASAAILDTPTSTAVYVTDLSVTDGGLITHRTGAATGLDLNVSGDATIDVSSAIHVDARGFGAASGPGAGAPDGSGSSNIGGGGGGYGGAGGQGNGGPAGGGTYGSASMPASLGSGGGFTPTATGGDGAGQILLRVGNALTVDGLISANGSGGGIGGSNTGGGGGSGGSIWLEVGSLAGSGTVRAEGGAGGAPSGLPRGGGGGGGRIAIHTCAPVGGPTLSVAGGTGATAGAVGTIFTSELGDGAACDDGTLCTAGSTCESGVCNGSGAPACPELPCQDAFCNPSNGACTVNNDDSESCSDDDACTQVDECQSGSCVGTDPVVCGALDQCHSAGVCEPLTGSCSNPELADDTPCEDGNLCTTDSCQGGSCTTSSTVTCTALDACHVAGVCDTGTGICSNPAAADGTACDDEIACTGSDVCTGGSCGGVFVEGCGDHYLSYTAKAPSRDALGMPIAGNALPSGWALTLDDVLLDNADADDPENYVVSKVKLLLTPARKNDEDVPAAPQLRYLSYQVKGAADGITTPLPGESIPKAVKHLPRRWELENQFGTIDVVSSGVRALLLPSAAEFAVAPSAPADTTHFLCYKVKVTKDVTDQTPESKPGSGVGKFRRGLQAFMDEALFDDCALLEDGSTASFAGSAVEGACLLDLKGPAQLCNPASKSVVEAPRVTSAVIDSSTAEVESSLLCYRAKLARKVRSGTGADLSGVAAGSTLDPAQSAHASDEGDPLLTAPGNLFPGPSQLGTIKPNMVCLPTQVNSVAVLP